MKNKNFPMITTSIPKPANPKHERDIHNLNAYKLGYKGIHFVIAHTTF